MRTGIGPLTQCVAHGCCRLKDRILGADLATEEELKNIEKDARKHVAAEVKKAKTGPVTRAHVVLGMICLSARATR